VLKCFRRELLEIGRSDDMDFSRIVEAEEYSQRHNRVRRQRLGQCEAVADFVDDPEMPPLE
jgi:hypothetical protein